MAVFTRFDPKTFEQCLKYVQDSIHWLVDKQNCVRVQPTVSRDTLTNTTNTLQLLIYKLKRFQNSMTPINRLPPEILSEIFLFVQGDTPYITSLLTFPTRSDPSHYQFDLVCQHWQQVIRHNPAFWTRIDLTYDTKPERVSSLLSRSGAMPLTIYIDCRVFVLKHSTLDRPQDREVISHAGRFKDLRVIEADMNFLTSFLARAHRLEAVSITRSWYYDNDDHDGVLPCTFPRLQVLSMAGTTLWQSWSTGNLRYVKFGPAMWGEHSISSMLGLFKNNPRLEELILWCISVHENDWDGIDAAVMDHSPSALPSLRRLLIQEPTQRAESADVISSPMSDIFSRIKLPHDCARHFRLAGGDAHIAFESADDELHKFPATRLFMDLNGVIGTDGVSTCAVYQGIYDSFLMEYIDDREIRELWLTECDTSDQDACLFWDEPAEPPLIMPNLTKLVVKRMVGYWLKKISTFQFGYFEELQIHTQDYEDEEDIIGFIEARKKNGHMLKTLRFVRESSPHYDSEAFLEWSCDPSKFAEHVVEVKFEERPCDGADADGFQFKLPDVCNTASPVHSEWVPWATFTC